MEKLLDQTFEYAIISPFKNYSSINLGKSTNTFFNDLDDIFDVDNVLKVKEQHIKKCKSGFLTFSSYRKTKKNAKYFYSNNDIGERLELFPLSQQTKNFYTSNQNQIKRHFGNPFSRIEIVKIGRMVYKDDNKFIIKIYNATKYRNVNWKYFKKTYFSYSLSFNLKTGNFNIIKTGNPTKKNTIFRTNSFDNLRQMITSETYFFLLSHIGMIENSKTKELFKKNLNDKDFLTTLNNYFFDNKLNLSTDSKYKEDIYRLIVEKFVKIRGIKVPDNYMNLLVNYYPKQKILNKNDNKLIQSILDMFNVKSKGTIKYIHENMTINISIFIELCHIFGDDYYHYISRVPPIYFSSSHTGSKYLVHTQQKFDLSKEEKDNILRLIIHSVNGTSVITNFNSLIRDHLNMMEVVRQFNPHIKFPTEVENFNIEHQKLSKLVSKIKRGTTIEYQFDEKMLSDVESEMSALKDFNHLIKLKPYVLKTDEDYLEEGEYMHHCVSGYREKDKSIIISLRTLDGKERVTNEFDIQSGICLQARYFSNQNPPEMFLDGLDILKDKVKKYARWGILNWKEKKRVPLKINGIEVPPQEAQPRTFADLLIEDPFFELNF